MMRSMYLSRRLLLYPALLWALLILFLHCWLSADGSPQAVVPTHEQPWRQSPAGEVVEVSRPFDFVDKTRVRIVPDLGEVPQASAYDIAEQGDKRDPSFYQGGTLSLTATPHGQAAPTPIIYDPYPEYNATVWRQTWKGRYHACDGPRGEPLQKTSSDDMVMAYRGSQKGFPWPAFGSHEAVGLDPNVCYDRCGRLAPYGAQGPGCPAHASQAVDWGNVDWGRLQDECAVRNANRYVEPRKKPVSVILPASEELPSPLQRRAGNKTKPKSDSGKKRWQQRAAVLLRTHDGLVWTDNHIHYVRSLMMELSLHTGGEYEVYVLIEVNDKSFDLKDDHGVRGLKEKYVPKEFHDITILFDQGILAQWYPGIKEHKAIFQHLQPTQIFSQLNPQFDHVWQLEFDARLTGHAYHFLSRAVAFGSRQPRKFLWERNAFTYTPGAHGTWDAFVARVDQAMADRADNSVWGPVVRPETMPLEPVGPKPPVASPSQDEYTWGVGEDADLLTFLPIFDPRDTHWTFPTMIWGVPPELPRRASPITMWRLSRRLLGLMHVELAGPRARAVVSEMSGPTWALLHGLKAVAVPHPIYADGNWTAHELAKVYNPNAETEPELVNGREDSVWTWNHRLDKIMYRLSYMFVTQFAEDLYRRWLGYPKDPDQEHDGQNHADPGGVLWYDSGDLDENTYGRLCYPTMLIHDIKNSDRDKGSETAVPLTW